MPSLYDDLKFDNGQYVPQYAGAPLEEIKDTANELSTRHYTNLANATQLDILANQLKSKLLPGAKAHVDKHIGALDQAISDIASQGGENATARINALAAALQGDQGILNATQRASEYNKQSTIIDQLTAKGDVPLYDKARREALANAPADSELYNSPYDALVEPYKDPNPEMEDIWKPINPDSYEGTIHQALGTKESELLGHALGQNDPSLFFETLTSVGISGSKIKDHLNAAWNNYKNTASYKQQTGKLIGKTEKQVKDEFLGKGLMRVFNNLKRDYRATPNPELRELLGKSVPGVPIPTLAPGTVLENSRSYDDSGHKITIVPGEASAGSAGQLINYSSPSERKKLQEAEGVTSAELDPQYIKDVNAMAELRGLKGVDPNSKEGSALAKEYKQLVGTRVQNDIVYQYNPETAKAVDDDLQRSWDLYQYLDADGKVIDASKDGLPTKEFINLTGGKTETFNVQGELDPKNHYALQTNNENFVKPIRVTARDKDGATRTFTVGQKPINTSPIEHNTNIVYSKTNLNPGQEVDLGGGIKAKAMIGKQLEGVDIGSAQYPIAASIPGVQGGKTLLYSDPEHLAKVLESVGHKLTLK